MIVGIDVGYSHTKAVIEGYQAIFPSVVGSPEQARFGLNKDDYVVLNRNGGSVLVGEGAIVQSRFVHRREDRRWIQSDEYRMLLHAAFSEVTGDARNWMQVVTGLPLSYYSDAEELRSLISGDHLVNRNGRGIQEFQVVGCRVIPQPFGSLFSLAFGAGGTVARAELLAGTVGIVDVGGHTTNLLAVKEARELVRGTSSIARGAWDVVQATKAYLSTTCRDLEPRDHEVVQAIVERGISYYGERVDLTEVVGAAVEPLASEVIAGASQLWDGGAGLDHILVTGGGAKLVGNQVAAHFSRHRSVTVLEDPVFANAVGYFRFGKYLERDGAW